MASYYPAADTDDSWEMAGGGGANYPTTNPLSVRASAADYRYSAVRVQLAGINQGDGIASAMLYGYFGNTSRDDIHCDVIGELVTAPGAFTTATNHITGRLAANPTTATAAWQFTGSGAGWYSVDVTSIVQELVNQASWPNDGYVVLFLDPSAYTSGEFGWIDSYSAANPWYLDVSTNAAPTIVPNTADASTLDTTPTVEFTGSDADDDDLRYQVQITDNPDGLLGGVIATTNFLGGYT